MSGAPIAGKAIAASASWWSGTERSAFMLALSVERAFRFRGSGHDPDCYVFSAPMKPRSSVR
jgi:hypothetical protein